MENEKEKVLRKKNLREENSGWKIKTRKEENKC